jgi:hypothetical protein
MQETSGRRRETCLVSILLALFPSAPLNKHYLSIPPVTVLPNQRLPGPSLTVIRFGTTTSVFLASKHHMQPQPPASPFSPSPPYSTSVSPAQLGVVCHELVPAAYQLPVALSIQILDPSHLSVQSSPLSSSLPQGNSISSYSPSPTGSSHGYQRYRSTLLPDSLTL